MSLAPQKSSKSYHQHSELIMNLDELSVEETSLLVLIEASYQDFNFTAEEQSFIMKNFGEEKFNQCNKLYKSLSTTQKSSLLLKYFEKSEAGEHHKLDGLLRALFLIDGDYCRFEKEFYLLFTRIKNSISLA